MHQYNQPGRQPEQPMQGDPSRGQFEGQQSVGPAGGQPGGVQQPQQYQQPQQGQQPQQYQQPQQGQQGQQPQQHRSLVDMSITSPTLVRLTIGHPEEQIELGEDDRVLESEYNSQINAWEVLVILQPREAEEEGEE